MKRLPIWLLLLTSTGACTSRTMVSQLQFQVAPRLLVERFLLAANIRDLESMASLFGTEDGPVGDTERRTDVALEMDLIAEILQHDDYEIVSERTVPGTEVPSIRLGVDLVVPGGAITVRDVGFTVILESSNRWLINVIELEKILALPPGRRRRRDSK